MASEYLLDEELVHSIKNWDSLNGRCLVMGTGVTISGGKTIGRVLIVKVGPLLNDEEHERLISYRREFANIVLAVQPFSENLLLVGSGKNLELVQISTEKS